MEQLVSWRAELPGSIALFAEVAALDPRIDATYGVVGGALLWSVREEAGSGRLPETLKIICAAGNVDPLLHAVEVLGRSAPLDGARVLAEMVAQDEQLRAQLDRVIAYFLEDCLRHGLLKRLVDIKVTGRVEGANIVIGGVQYVAGNLVVSHTVVQRPRVVRPVAPAPPRHFTGRATDLAQLREALSAGHNVAITGIHGMGGIGKTAIARQVAADMPGFSVVLWAALGPAPNTVALLADWARHADPDFVAGDGPVEGLVNRVRATLTTLVDEHFPGRVLVVLDDVWEGDSVAAARHLLAASPSGAVHLITTRSLRVVTQLRSNHHQLLPMTSDDALGMLRTLLPGFPDITDADLRDLAGIVGHHPLAMEIAAGQVTLLERPQTEIGELLAKYRGGIPAGSPFRDIRLELGETREDNLELVLSFSYEELDSADRARFRALGVLAYDADFDTVLCEAVWEAGDPKPALDLLRHRALLSIAASPGWYQQHQLIRAYARALLYASDHRQSTEDRFTMAVVGVSAAFSERPVDQWHNLDPYLPNIEEAGSILVSAIEAELSANQRDLVRLRRMLDFALNTRVLLAIRTELHHPEWTSAGVAVSSYLGESSHEVPLLNALGLGQNLRGQTTAAIRSLYRARRRAEETRDLPGTARTFGNLGAVVLQYDADSAPQWLYRSVELWTRLGDEPELARVLLLLADWQANSFRTFSERTTALLSLTHAVHLAAQHGLVDVRAEADLRTARLFDSLGDPSMAVPILEGVIEVFARIGRRDREGVARLFLAAAVAAAEPERAAEMLNSAIKLFRSSGHATGHATALRNLAQLHAEAGRPAEALAAHADALTLVRTATEGFLDEDEVEDFIVRGHFTVRYEEIVRQHEVEQYREQGRAAVGAGADFVAALPEDLNAYLINQTITVSASSPHDRQEWADALQHFLDIADGLHHLHRAFVHGLIDVTLGNPARRTTGTHHEELVAEIRMRSEQLRKTGERSHLREDDALDWVRRTNHVLTDGPQHHAGWEKTLRANLRGATKWGDAATADYCRALLCVLADQPAALPHGHRHRELLEALLGTLFRSRRLPADVLAERTVATLVVQAGEPKEWIRQLESAKRETARLGNRWGVEFIGALSALTSGDRPALPASHPHHDDLARVVDAVTNGTLLFTLIPDTQLAELAGQVIEARTGMPKTSDGLFQRLGAEAERARAIGRHSDADLYEALIQIIHNESPSLPARHPYAGLPEAIIAEIGERGRVPCADQTMPDQDVAWLVDLVVNARDGEHDAYIANYVSVMLARGSDWQHEAALLVALGDLLRGADPVIPQDNPYATAVDKARQEIRRNTELNALGGPLSAADLRDLLDSAAGHLSRTRAFADSFTAMPTGTAAIAAFLQDRMDSPQLRRNVLEQNRWEHDLLAWRDDLVRRGPEWQYGIELIDAVIAMVKLAPLERLSAENPYAGLVQELRESFPPMLQMPADDSIAALSLDKDEFVARWRPTASQDLGDVLTAVVLSRTMLPEKHDELLNLLHTRQDSLVGHAAYTAEQELYAALARIMRDEDPGLPADHRYAADCELVRESVDVFHGRLTWPGSLTGDEIARAANLTIAARTSLPDYLDRWSDELTSALGQHTETFPGERETTEFLRALAVLLEGRAAHLTAGNRYEPFLTLVRNQAQLRP